MGIGRAVSQTSEIREAGAGSAISRRNFLKLSGVGLAGVGLLGTAGCGGGGEGSGANLRWSMWADSPEEKKVWENLANAVTEAYPKIKVDLETIPFQDYWDKLQTQLASENEADIIGMQSLRMPGFAARGALQSLRQFSLRPPTAATPKTGRGSTSTSSLGPSNTYTWRGWRARWSTRSC
jgi:maltose-binding protein MalE